MLYRYPLPKSHYIEYNGSNRHRIRWYESDSDGYESDDNMSTVLTATNKPNPMQDTESSSLGLPLISDIKEDIDIVAPPFILALPAEVLLEIFKNPALFADDLASIRLVCKQFNLYATESFAYQSFQGSLRFDFSVHELTRLAAICSSALCPFLKSVHFIQLYSSQVTQVDTKMHADYSAIKEIKFESSLGMVGSTRAFGDLLALAKHLEVFSFSAAKPRKGIHWYEQQGLAYFHNEKRATVGKRRDREMVDTILSSLRSDCLTELHLADMAFSVETLKALLERHCGTIRKFSLRGCELRQGSWTGLLQWMLQNLSCLNQIDLHHVYEIPAQPWGPWGYLKPVVMDLVTEIGKESIEAYIASLQKQDKS
ncbi:hypothetical protein KCV07_g6119, partial [Aureobasidium melanogenum]